MDWHLLLFLASQFVVVEGLNGTALPDQIYGRDRGVFGVHAAAQAWNLAWFSALGSKVFSNVPFVLVAGKWIGNFADPEAMVQGRDTVLDAARAWLAQQPAKPTP